MPTLARLSSTAALTLLLLGSTLPVAEADGEVPVGQGTWPLQPRPEVVEGFAPPATAYGRGHRGVDLLGHQGQTVHATLAGRVSFATTLAGRGVVVVDHGGFRTTYEPVSATVSRGETVAKGGSIGLLQRAGSHCFPRACLHWGLIQGLLRGSTYLDPLVLVGAGPIRLLPLAGPAPSPAHTVVRTGGHGRQLV